MKMLPAGTFAPVFTHGSFRNFDEVLHFGKDKDIITVEIEHVNVDALDELERMGKKVYPQPAVLRMYRTKVCRRSFTGSIRYPLPSSG